MISDYFLKCPATYPAWKRKHVSSRKCLYFFFPFKCGFKPFPILITFWSQASATAKSLQSCPTLCDPIDGSPPGSPIPGILQARTLEWVAISFSNAWKWKVKVKLLSRLRLLVTIWTAAYQAPPSMGFSGQEYWSGCHCQIWLSIRTACQASYKILRSPPRPNI